MSAKRSAKAKGCPRCSSSHIRWQRRTPPRIVMRHLKAIHLLSLAIMLAMSAGVSRAQDTSRKAAVVKPPAGYAGSAACADCHKVAVAQFAATSKGKLFLEHPRDAKEALGCESCHGPAKQHVQTGGEERGGLITFGKKAPASVAVRNAT